MQKESTFLVGKGHAAVLANLRGLRHAAGAIVQVDEKRDQNHVVVDVSIEKRAASDAPPADGARQGVRLSAAAVQLVLGAGRKDLEEVFAKREGRHLKLAGAVEAKPHVVFVHG